MSNDTIATFLNAWDIQNYLGMVQLMRKSMIVLGSEQEEMVTAHHGEPSHALIR